MRYLAASIVIFLYLIICWLCWRRYRDQQRHLLGKNVVSADVMVAYASQTGAAIMFARQTIQQLQEAGTQTAMLSLNQLTPELLRQTKTLLIIASTYGEGEAPDNGNRFLQHCLANLTSDSLQQLQVAILGLGDSSYQKFCGFAHQLHAELQHYGAHFITDVIEVDKLDESALRHWQYYLGQISGKTHYADWSKPVYAQWQIVQRDCINPGSPGAPAYHLKLSPVGRNITPDEWQAGDIAEIGPGNSDKTIANFLRMLGRENLPHDALAFSNLELAAQRLDELKAMDDETIIAALEELPHREYSIASVPSENSLDLLVRQVNVGPGSFGLGSGWLSVHARLHQPLRLRIRRNERFHSPANNCPLILIGNGTGIAGLRAHLANPARAGTRNWLFFGERTAAADNFFSADLQHWQDTGLLTRLDQIFSRDAPDNSARYVQDLLAPNAIELRAWIAQGASVFVCGSLHGMAQAVDDSLRDILGADQLEHLAESRRYCRDVY